MIGKYEYERVDKDTGKDCHRIFLCFGKATVAL